MNGHVLCLAEILIAIVDSSARLHAAACSESLMVGFTRDRSVSCCPCKTIDQQMSVTHRMDGLYSRLHIMRQLVGAAPHRQSRGGGVTFGVSVLTQQINNSSESADRLSQLLHAWRPDR